MTKVKQLLRWILFIIRAPLFKNTHFLNYAEQHVNFHLKKYISLGKNNKFKSYSKISVDYSSCNQYISIGNHNTFESYATLRTQGGNIQIGNNNYFAERSQLQGYGGIEIGNNCMIAANTFISSSNHDFSNPKANNYLLNEIGKKTIIGNSTWIGANCTVLAGITIGNFCVIGAGSVVTKNIPDYHIAFGNPAKIVKKFDTTTNVWCKI